ncbi:MAG: helix-turn-helix transcriptional regulator [Oscillibacter sp.]|nr:helix-turn-helix transcriptional regulator [uncultured Oscillibacter sp.]MCI8813127.1 helix-turn-helix transcriptional regulator [Oscillibacter sp.]
MEFSKRLRELRKEKNETQVQTAKAIEVTERQYQRFEAGENYPGFENLCALADHFSVSLDYLSGRTDKR